jgi:hypothetical protein
MTDVVDGTTGAWVRVCTRYVQKAHRSRETRPYLRRCEARGHQTAPQRRIGASVQTAGEALGPSTSYCASRSGSPEKGRGTAEKWKTGLGRLAWGDGSSTPGSTQPGPTRSTPHRCLFRGALASPARRRQVQPVYLLPNGSQAPSDAGGNARGAEYPRQHRQTPFPRLCSRRGIRQKIHRLLYTYLHPSVKP